MEREATLAEITDSARRTGEELAGAFRPFIDDVKGCPSETSQKELGLIVRSTMHDQFLRAVNEGLSPKELKAYSRGLRGGMKAGLAKIYAPWLERERCS